MMEYLKPAILECGTSESIIKGQCGWGTETVLFDKENTIKGVKRRVNYSQTCPGGGVVTICTICRTITTCSDRDNEC